MSNSEDEVRDLETAMAPLRDKLANGSINDVEEGILTEMFEKLNRTVEKDNLMRRRQRISASRIIYVHSYLFYLFPSGFNLFPFYFI